MVMIARFFVFDATEFCLSLLVACAIAVGNQCLLFIFLI